MPKQTSYTSIPDLNRSLRAVPKLAAGELRDASALIAGEVGDEARAAAVRLGGVARLVAPTIKVGRDRIPTIKLGAGTGRLPTSPAHPTRSSGQRVGDPALGAEFGGGRRPTTHQFRPHRGRTGYFLWPTVRAHSDRTQAQYSAALDDALQRIP